MVVNRVILQSSVMVSPSVFSTATEIASQLGDYSGIKFCIIPTSKFTPALMVSRDGNKITVSSSAKANNKKVFDQKITSVKAQRIPHGYTLYFNVDGKVLGAAQATHKKAYSNDLGKKLPFDETRGLVARTGLPMVDHIILGSRSEFVYTLVSQLLGEDPKIPFDNVSRTGFYIGDGPLRHTNKISLTGPLSVVFSHGAKVRIKGIHKHSPEHAETVFWFELKQASTTLYDILKEEELKSTFMDGLIKCL